LEFIAKYAGCWVAILSKMIGVVTSGLVASAESTIAPVLFAIRVETWISAVICVVLL
jgi:hypothetical protein